MSGRCRVCGSDWCDCKPAPVDTRSGHLWPDRAPPSSNDSTSKSAAELIKPVARQVRDLVLRFIESEGGATSEEIQDALGLSGDTVRPRVWELRGNGGHPSVIRDSGRVRSTKAGRKAKVWEVVA